MFFLFHGVLLEMLLPVILVEQLFLYHLVCLRFLLVQYSCLAVVTADGAADICLGIDHVVLLLDLHRHVII